MFAHRMERLHQGLGYDLFIDVDQLDRTPDKFVQLLNQCIETVNHSSRDHASS